MAIMIPDQIPNNAPQSEKIIFQNLMYASRSRNWVVFYSEYVNNPNHPARPREIDFLILTDNCSVICLEVKGGSYEINNREWYRLPNHELVHPSPPEQARTAMFAVEKEFSSYFGGNSLLSLGCAVAFTDSEFQGVRLPPECLIIERDDARDPDKLFDKLANYADQLPTTHVKYQLQHDREKCIEALDTMKNLQVELERTVNFTMRMDPQKILSSDLLSLQDQFLVPTADQLQILGLVNLNPNSCFVINGAAGTGKTVLAMEIARQRCEEKGEKVALICSNPYLSSRFERWTNTLSKDNGGNVVVGTLEAFSIADSQNQEKFDYLIVDEAQNLCDEESRSLMDGLLEGELTNGNWAMFGDFEYQNIVNPTITETGEEVLAKLQEIYPRVTRGDLEINCRNTYEIAAAVSMLVDIPTLPRSGVHGPLIQIEYFNTDSPEDLDKLLNELVKDLQDRKFLSRQIILLSSSSDDFTVPPREYGGWGLLNVKEIADETDLDRENVPIVSGDSSPNTLKYSNIHDFQGLESEVVILVMPLTEKQTEAGGVATLPDYEYLKRVLYTGMSRAKAMLIIVAGKSYEEHLDLEPLFEDTYKDFIETTAQDVRESNTV